MTSLASARRYGSGVGNVLLFAIPIGVLVYAVATAATGTLGDFRVFWDAAEDVLAGRSPYPPVDAVVLAGQDQFVYPAPAALLVAPLGLLPLPAAQVVWLVLSVCALGGALHLLGVRDRRCYALAAICPPVTTSVLIGTLTPFLVLGVAVAWHYRERALVVGLAVAALIATKLFLWPLLVWLLATRRFHAAALAAASSATACLVAWAAIGFDGLRDFRELLATLSDLLQGKGYSLTALGLSFGLEPTAARTAATVAGVALLVLVAAFAHRRRDQAAFVIALAAALALSPIVWLHYFALLLVPIAVSRPRLAPPWLVLLGFFALPHQSVADPPWSGLVSVDLGGDDAVGPAVIVGAGILLAAIALALSLRRDEGVEALAERPNDRRSAKRTQREYSALSSTSV